MAALTRDEAAELRLLQFANEKGKFGISLIEGKLPAVEIQEAFERGIDGEWFTLVDVSILTEAETGPGLMRVFRLTPAGITRREVLAFRSGGGRAH